MQKRSEAEVAALAANVVTDDDPEATYLFTGHLSYCGQTETALRFLQNTVEANYCSYPVMDTDLMLANIRGKPKFLEIRAAGIACQKNFDTQRGASAQ